MKTTRIDVATYERLRAAGLAEKQALALAVSLPDWTQFATKADLSRLEHKLAQGQTQMLLWVAGLLIVGPPLWLWVYQLAALP